MSNVSAGDKAGQLTIFEYIILRSMKFCIPKVTLIADNLKRSKSAVYKQMENMIEKDLILKDKLMYSITETGRLAFREAQAMLGVDRL